MVGEVFECFIDGDVEAIEFRSAVAEDFVVRCYRVADGGGEGGVQAVVELR